MLWKSVLLVAGTAIVVVVSSCANGRILDSGNPHKKSATLLTAPHQSWLKIKPAYSGDAAWTGIPKDGLWVSGGNYAVIGCVLTGDAAIPQTKLHIPGGHRFEISCASTPPYSAILVDVTDSK